MKINPYGSLTTTSSQVPILYGYYVNSEYYNPFYDYVIIRTGEYEYTLYYGRNLEIGTSDANYIQYYRTGSTSNYIYKFRTGHVNDFSVSTDTYTSVGTIKNTISNPQYTQIRDTSVIMMIITAILITVTIFKLRGSFNVIRRHH